MNLGRSFVYRHFIWTVAESLDAAEDLITMDNGCVCCSVSYGIVVALNGWISKPMKDATRFLAVMSVLVDCRRPDSKAFSLDSCV